MLHLLVHVPAIGILGGRARREVGSCLTTVIDRDPLIVGNARAVHRMMLLTYCVRTSIIPRHYDTQITCLQIWWSHLLL